MNNALTRFVLPLILPVLAVICGAFAGSGSAPGRTVWIIVALCAVGCTGVVLIMTARQSDHALRTAVSARADLATALARVGQPLIMTLSEVAVSGRNRRESGRNLLEKVVQVAQAQCGRTGLKRPGVRAVFYRLDKDSLNLVYVAPSTKRMRPPRNQFHRSFSKYDSETIDLAQGQDSLLVPDLQRSPPESFPDPESRSYSSYIVTPVRAGERSFGVIGVDADEPRSLTTVDVGYVQLLSGLLAVGLSLLNEAELDIALDSTSTKAELG